MPHLDTQSISPPKILTTPEYYSIQASHPEILADPNYNYQTRGLRQEANFYHALHNLYLEHGWPNSFRGQEFEAAKRVWDEKVKNLGSMAGVEFGDGRFPGPMDVSDQLEEFLRAGAGEKAV